MQQPVEVQVDEHEPIVERVAAIDVAKASGMVCLRIPHETIPDRRVTKIWPVAATTAALVELGDHLRCERVTRVVVESTSDYWRPFHDLLEAAGLTVWRSTPRWPRTSRAAELIRSSGELAHLPTSAPFRAQPPGLVSGQLSRAVDGGVDHVAAGFLPSFDHRHSLVGHPAPAAEFRSPHGRPTKQPAPGPDGISTFRTSESRPDWVPSLPRGPAVLTRPVRSLRSPLAPHFQGPGPITPALHPISRSCPITRRHQGFTRVHPPGLPPRLVIPWMDQGPLGSSPGLRTPTGRTCGARQGGGRASSTRPELHDRHRRTLLSMSSLVTCDLASHDRPGHERVRHPATVVLLGQGRAPHRAVRAQDRPGPHRQRQPLPQIRARPDRHRRREDRHLPRRTLPAVDQTHAQGQGPGRAATLHPGHLLPPARRPHRRVHRPRTPTSTSAASTAPAAPPTCCANCTPWATRSSSPSPPPNPRLPSGSPAVARSTRPRRRDHSPAAPVVPFARPRLGFPVRPGGPPAGTVVGPGPAR